jgi:hypothetical protein
MRRSQQLQTLFQIERAVQRSGTPCLLTIMLATPILLFNQLRSLALRARSAHLAEHCTIVGFGTSIAMLYILIVLLITTYARELHFNPYWASRSKSWLILMAVAGTLSALFLLWSLYLLIRFAVAFHIASRKLRNAWNRDDRALAAG